MLRQGYPRQAHVDASTIEKPGAFFRFARHPASPILFSYQRFDREDDRLAQPEPDAGVKKTRTERRALSRRGSGPRVQQSLRRAMHRFKTDSRMNGNEFGYSLPTVRLVQHADGAAGLRRQVQPDSATRAAAALRPPAKTKRPPPRWTLGQIRRRRRGWQVDTLPHDTRPRAVMKEY